MDKELLDRLDDLHEQINENLMLHKPKMEIDSIDMSDLSEFLDFFSYD